MATQRFSFEGSPTTRPLPFVVLDRALANQEPEPTIEEEEQSCPS
jgi:hypothetical protein